MAQVLAVRSCGLFDDDRCRWFNRIAPDRLIILSEIGAGQTPAIRNVSRKAHMQRRRDGCGWLVCAPTNALAKQAGRSINQLKHG